MRLDLLSTEARRRNDAPRSDFKRKERRFVTGQAFRELQMTGKIAESKFSSDRATMSYSVQLGPIGEILKLLN